MLAPVRDLHVHSSCSDGLFGPSELVRQAIQSGVEELSLTDHDTLTGLEEAERTSRSLGIRFMPGLELTCRFKGRTIHMLGYGFRPAIAEGDTQLSKYLADVKQRDHEWARTMCRKSCADPIVLKTPGGQEHRISVREEELSWVRGTMPSSFHIAVVLSRKLACISDELNIPARHCMYLFTGRLEPTYRSASYWPEIRQRYADLIDRYSLPVRAHWWTQRPTSDVLEASDAVETIDRIGGIPVLAHPGEQKLSVQQIKDIAELGVKGLEVYTFKHGPDLILELEALAEDLGLFATSGTDFHGPYHRAQVRLGRDRSGEYLRSGLSMEGFRELGAYVLSASYGMCQ
jgi:3',5'-nucleoside bisphosphate phosphatase